MLRMLMLWMNRNLRFIIKPFTLCHLVPVTPIQPQMTHLQPAELDISIDSSVGGNNDYQCWYFTMNNEITWRFTSHNFIRRAEYPPNLNCLKLITGKAGT